MKVTLVQTDLIWENAEANRERLTQMINGMDGDTDLIILPEMFSTGFTMAPQGVAETMEGVTVSWMRDIAAEKACAVAGSLVIEEAGKYYNRLLFVLPDGEIRTYNKRHLFSLAGEDEAFTAGKDRLILTYKGWKICPLVCYDLRFPVFSRNTEDYDLLLYVANWPESRVTAWDALLRARAIENMCYTVGVNRIGRDSNETDYSGHSQVLDSLGQCLIEPSSAEGIFTVDLDKQELLETRHKFGFLNDRDSFTLRD
jgi:omega-amidase